MHLFRTIEYVWGDGRKRQSCTAFLLGIILVGWIIEALVLVVVSVPDNSAAPTPSSNGRGVHAELVGNLRLSELAQLTKAVITALQSIVASQPGHNARVERQLFALI